MMATGQHLLRGCESIRSKPGLQELFLALDTFRPENTNFEAMISFHEHHCRYFFGKIEDLKDFLIFYTIEINADEENIPNYLVMLNNLRKLEVLEGMYFIACPLASPTTQEGQKMRSQYEALVILHTAVRSKLEELMRRITEKEEELQRLPGTSTQEIRTAEESAQETRGAEEEAVEETPAAEGERLTLRRRVRKALKRQFQRIWRATRSLFRGGCCHQPPPAP
ncbi:uncharacterized protein LOC116409488 [Xenopus tropicalis]|uniref:Uncharacterized protein LOC116409488 n=1 Tax=Xenopus tropicalis TaxID=8364 RepID=A0A8J1JAF9_XENTR|nr:uncharacterized protein LOC116409488 [Xenopus tropicalis]